MSTGAVETWKTTIADIGPIYPFVGSEWLLVILALVFWIAWHFLQMGIENHDTEEALRKVSDRERLKSEVERAGEQ